MLLKFGKTMFYFANIGKPNYLQKTFKIVNIYILMTTEIFSNYQKVPIVETLLKGQKLLSAHISKNPCGALFLYVL